MGSDIGASKSNMPMRCSNYLGRALSLSEHAQKIEELLTALRNANYGRKGIGRGSTNKDQIKRIQQALRSHLRNFENYSNTFPAIQRALAAKFIEEPEYGFTDYEHVEEATARFEAALIDIKALSKDPQPDKFADEQIKEMKELGVTLKDLERNTANLRKTVEEIQKRVERIHFCPKCTSILIDPNAQYCGVCGTELKSK